MRIDEGQESFIKPFCFSPLLVKFDEKRKGGGFNILSIQMKW